MYSTILTEDTIQDSEVVNCRRDKKRETLAKELVDLYEELNACIKIVGKEGHVAGQESV